MTATRPATASTAAVAPAAGRRRSKPAEPERPPEPRWIGDLSPRERGRARRLIERLEAGGVRDAESIVRQDLTGGVPTVARLAIANQLAELLASAAGDAPAIERAIGRVVEILVAGRDDELGVRWRLVDGDDRPIGLTAGTSGRGSSGRPATPERSADDDGREDSRRGHGRDGLHRRDQLHGRRRGRSVRGACEHLGRLARLVAEDRIIEASGYPRLQLGASDGPGIERDRRPWRWSATTSTSARASGSTMPWLGHLVASSDRAADAGQLALSQPSLSSSAAAGLPWAASRGAPSGSGAPCTTVVTITAMAAPMSGPTQ